MPFFNVFKLLFFIKRNFKKIHIRKHMDRYDSCKSDIVNFCIGSEDFESVASPINLFPVIL